MTQMPGSPNFKSGGIAAAKKKHCSTDSPKWRETENNQ